MSQTESGQPMMDQLPYYQEYVEQILKPRVARVVEDVRARLADQVWADLLERIAEDQRPGSAADVQALTKLKTMLEQTLRLRIRVDLAAEFDGAAAPAPEARPVDGRKGAEVVDRAFPNNPLARAVGGLRQVGR